MGDPARAHGTALEGYYWRIVDPVAGRVVVVLCGVCRAPGGTWAVVALAGHPGGFLRHACVSSVATDADRFGARAGSVLSGSAERLRLRLDGDAWIDVRLKRRVGRPGRVFGALGAAHVIPGLPQYWHPAVLSAHVDGKARLGGASFSVDHASGYVEKNWGAAFPERWWWGHADAFPEADATVAFAGGPMAIGPARLAATAVVVRIGERVLRLAPPLALVRAAAMPGGWRIRARSARCAVHIEGDAGGGSAHVLPVPDVEARRVRMRSMQHLAGRLRLQVRRGRSIALEAESPLAGLELGVPEQVGHVPPGAPPP